MAMYTRDDRIGMIEEKDIVKTDGTPFDGDSRYIIKRIIAEAKDMGYDFDVAIRRSFSYLTLAKTKSRPEIPVRRAAILMYTDI